MAKKRKYCDPKTCTLIQWEENHFRKGRPACPRCGKSAEKCLGFFGNPCWAHETREAKRLRKGLTGGSEETEGCL